MKDIDILDISVLNIAEVLKKTPGANVFLSEVWKLIKILLFVPVSAASAERSFSALRRLKTYVQATMGQPRRNHVLQLHCNQERTDQLNLNDVAQQFICAVEQRANFFGNFG